VSPLAEERSQGHGTRVRASQYENIGERCSDAGYVSAWLAIRE